MTWVTAQCVICRRTVTEELQIGGQISSMPISIGWSSASKHEEGEHHGMDWLFQDFKGDELGDELHGFSKTEMDAAWLPTAQGVPLFAPMRLYLVACCLMRWGGSDKESRS